MVDPTIRQALTAYANGGALADVIDAAGRAGEPVLPVLSADLLLHQRDALLELAKDAINRLSVSLGEDASADWRRRLGEATPAN